MTHTNERRAKAKLVLLGFVWGGLIWQPVASLTAPVVADLLLLALAIVGIVNKRPES